MAMQRARRAPGARRPGLLLSGLLPPGAVLPCLLAAACAQHGLPGRVEPARAATGLENHLEWTTARETRNLGFDVYRSTAPTGPFERITEQPIPGAGDSTVARHYEYVDRDVEPGRSYYYFVESISVGGERRRITPIQHVTPKDATGGDAPEGREAP